MAMWSMICGLTTTIDLTTKISHPQKINCRIDKENPSAKGESWAKFVKLVRDNLKISNFPFGIGISFDVGYLCQQKSCE